jgi:hypothetical protein
MVIGDLQQCSFTSKIMSLTAVRKVHDENDSRTEFLASNPPSYGDIFFSPLLFFFKIKVARIITFVDSKIAFVL